MKHLKLFENFQENDPRKSTFHTIQFYYSTDKIKKISKKQKMSF